MKITDAIIIAFRVLRFNWLRSALTIVGIAVAVSTILLLAGLGAGVQNITIGSIVQSKSLYSLDVTTSESNVPPVDLDAITEIENLPGIQKVSPVYVLEGQFEYNGKTAAAALKAGTSDYLSMEGIKIIAGTNFDNDLPEIVISPYTLALLETTADNILGQEITINMVNPPSPSTIMKFDTKFKVVGITENSDNASANFISYKNLTKFENVQPVSIKALAKDRDSILVAQTALRTKGYQTDSLIDVLDQARKVFSWMTFALVVVATIALLVAAIGMFNTLTITLIEQTHEIGIMKAIGISNITICKIFLMESTILGFLGGLCGLILGYCVSIFLGAVINRLAVQYGGATTHMFLFSTKLMVGMALYPSVLGLFTGFYPAIRASLMNPLKALRYE